MGFKIWMVSSEDAMACSLCAPLKYQSKSGCNFSNRAGAPSYSSTADFTKCSRIGKSEFKMRKTCHAQAMFHLFTASNKWVLKVIAPLLSDTVPSIK